MLSTMLVSARWLPIVALIGFAVVGPLIGALLVRHRRLTAVLLAVSVCAVLGLTLVPDGDPSSAVACAAGLPYLSPTSVESLSNVLLLAPSALLAGVLLRRPVVGAAAAIGVSALVEATQALVPAIGRACDTSDLLTNALGALLGGGLAAVALAVARRRSGNSSPASSIG